MSRRKRPSMPVKEPKGRDSYLKLSSSDKSVLNYLHEITQSGNDGTCTISIPKIAEACEISERQVQISTGKLMRARLLERVGYDLGNADRSKRGTVYKVITKRLNKLLQPQVAEVINGLLDGSEALYACLEQLVMMHSAKTNQIKDASSCLRHIRNELVKLKGLMQEKK